MMTENVVRGTLAADSGLKFCTTKEQIEDLFAKSGIRDPEDKVFLLQKSMGVISAFSAPSPVNLTPEQEYEDELAIFLEGSWRLLSL